MTARWIPFLLMAAMGVAVQAQSQSQNRFALTAAQVALAVSASGMQTTAGHVSLLTRVVATEPEPVLDVLSVETLGKGPLAEQSDVRLRVKLACHIQGKCLPFYAIVSSPPSTAGAANITPKVSLRSGNTVWNTHTEIIMKAGAHATLMMDDQRSHIQVAVVSLENGIVGHRIHVASPDHKQTYVGEVVNARLLRGSF
jgi:flagella basal body P-ring formation protein FlgA